MEHEIQIREGAFYRARGGEAFECRKIEEGKTTFYILDPRTFRRTGYYFIADDEQMILLKKNVIVREFNPATETEIGLKK